jgi:hypothetical protein
MTASPPLTSPPASDNGPALQFFVFSFNRGEHLLNCLRSLERCAPQCPVTIVDDNSTDPATMAVLAGLDGHHRIVRPGHSRASKHGGLYANMQSAFEACPADTLFCFLQDDMQLVRRLDAQDLAHFAAVLDGSPLPCLLQPAFMKGYDRRRHQGLIRYRSDSDAYCIDRLRHSAGAWYSDILLGSAGRLRQAGWQFLPSEAANEQQARRNLGQLLYLKNPFVAWLPNVPAWRGKQQTLGLRLAHRSGNCGLHPLRCLDAPQTAEFLTREPEKLPYAEDWLELVGTSLPKPWAYHPLQGRRLLKWLNSLELKLRRLLR